MSKKIVRLTGNWKMYKTIAEAKQFIETVAAYLTQSQDRPSFEGIQLAVPYTMLYALTTWLSEKKIPLAMGAQNVAADIEGAFTGEISARMLKEVGAFFVLVGHSERRHLFGETDEMIAKKISRALEEGLKVTLCIGETLQQRERKEQGQVIERQIERALGKKDAHTMDSVTLAYEPVWAIGTGKVASAAQADEMHAHIRALVRAEWGEEVAQSLCIQYGGSVKIENAAELLREPNVDGLLIGGSSLDATSFSKIILQSRGC